jgi:hypothetical protein
MLSTAYIIFVASAPAGALNANICFNCSSFAFALAASSTRRRCSASASALRVAAVCAELIGKQTRNFEKTLPFRQFGEGGKEKRAADAKAKKERLAAERKAERADVSALRLTNNSLCFRLKKAFNQPIQYVSIFV